MFVTKYRTYLSKYVNVAGTQSESVMHVERMKYYNWIKVAPVINQFGRTELHIQQSVGDDGAVCSVVCDTNFVIN